MLLLTAFLLYFGNPFLPAMFFLEFSFKNVDEAGDCD
jgi:hypothetical protein